MAWETIMAETPNNEKPRRTDEKLTWLALTISIFAGLATIAGFIIEVF